MGFSCGIVGLPNVGKSTIFNALTHAHAPASNYPFCTIDPNIGIVSVPDPRLDALASMLSPPKVTPTTLEIRDIAGLVEGAHQGKGRGNQFLSHIRNVDVIAHVIRCFEDPDVPHVDPQVNPVRDLEVLETELILADLQHLERRLDRARKASKSLDKNLLAELEVLERIEQTLDSGQMACEAEIPEHLAHHLDTIDLLTMKPMFLVANVHESDLQEPGPLLQALRSKALGRSMDLVEICGKVEAEVLELDPEERDEFLSAYGLRESGLQRFIEVGYRLLQLITFYTVVGRELRAWTVPRGTPAPKAAGKIHSDMERGFIRAEVIHFDQFKRHGSLNKARQEGAVRYEGKDYEIQDGDIVTFRFHAS